MTSLVSSAWLADHLSDPNVIVLDASFKLPGAKPTAYEEFTNRHIPSAQFFDVDKVADEKNPLPHMMPSKDKFARAVGALGISNSSMVVIYDTLGLMSAGRAWWMFRSFGHPMVAILDGGLKSWTAEGRPMTSELTKRAETEFKAEFDPAVVASKADMLANMKSELYSVIDARSAARFSAKEKEVRPGLRSGHIPGSLNVPFDLMTDPITGKMRSPQEITQVFRGAGLEMTRPVIASCGSGVTACALAFGLHLVGKDDVKIYDGAWAEWGMLGDTPVVSGK